jgi:hypothetical protein
VTASFPNKIAGLAGRLIDSQDREVYAELMCYLNSLPPADEFRRLAELLGLLSLLGQRLPDALAECLAEMRHLTDTAGQYYGDVDRRLVGLPYEITKGVDTAAIAKAMSESFRQQLAATGLQDTAALLRSSSGEIKAVSSQILAMIKPVTEEYRGISASISGELDQLRAASAQLRQHNAALFVQERANSWLWQGMCALALFLLGGLLGILWEKRETTDALNSVFSQLERIQTPVTCAPVDQPNKIRRQKGL